jgi:inhibitor of cysteine peptidase
MRWAKKLLAGLVLLLALPLLAGADKKPDKDRGDKEKKAVVVTAKQDGKTVTVAKGGTLQVKLEMRAGTGFIWVVEKVDKKVLEQKGKYTTEKIKGARPIGGPRLQVYTFTGKGTGETKLVLFYKRPFEKDKEPAKKFTVTVKVKDN